MSQSNHPRRVGRETVLQAMYAYEILNEDKDKILKDILSNCKNTKEKLNVMTSPLPVNFVLEIAGGRSTKLQLKLGQRMKFKF